MRCVLLKRPWIRSYVAGLLGFSIVKLDSFFWSKERGPVLGVRCSQQSPKYTSKDVKNHNTIQKGVWISYEGRVYDITGFIDRHPGGKIIMQAAGKDLGPFFEKFKFHKTENIIKMLDEYLIGELEDLEPPKPMPPPEKQMDEFSSEPTRSEHLIVNSGQPFNAETPVTALIDNFYTPNEVFFVRNHMPVPQIDPATHKISFCTQRKYLMDYLEEDFVKEELDVRKGFKQEILCKSLNIFDLINKYEHLDVEATLQCTGNRRDGMNTVKPVVGIPWKGGAIGNALWKGVRLHDVLSDLGISVDGIKSQKAHVMMIGADKNSVDEHYEVSVPLRFAIQPNTILAFKMNGTDLPPDHGYPVRMIIPGITGARNVKWLQKVIVIDMESQSIWQQEDYRCYSPDKTRISRIF
ncbi:putative sulfite oxidase, mitochondrial [Thelohanellus kitauei]|uniref:sulfite oxidase n=1 Tax=Thelohanellus kitauei TaxID=669202 RepID=A0A0C2J617_THEKT|nr:putative sulfite oxidase, mitochondrial [Thelohanellus kitauei]